MDKKNSWTYGGYLIGLFSGNPLVALTGAGTKFGQDVNQIPQTKTVDYVRAGAFAYMTLDCLLGIGHTFHNSKEFWETTTDAIMMLSLYTDLKNYSGSQNPLKDTFNNAKDSIKGYFKK